MATTLDTGSRLLDETASSHASYTGSDYAPVAVDSTSTISGETPVTVDVLASHNLGGNE